MYRLWQTYTVHTPLSHLSTHSLDEKAASLPGITDSLRSVLVEKENLPNENELGRIVRGIFPGVKKTKITVEIDGSTKKRWLYSNLVECESQTKLAWNDIITSYSPPKPETSLMCWVQNKCGSDCVQWMIIPSDCTCDGKRLIRELKLYKNSSCEFYVMSQKVSNGSFGHNVETFIPTKEFLDNLFEFCAAIPICRGFEVDVEKSTHDRHGNIVGSAKRWGSTSTDQTSLRHSSENCCMVLSVTGHSVICKCCANVKFNSFYKTLKPRDVNVDHKRKRESFMTQEELLNKLHEEKKQRINAERREKCAKEKVLEQMKVFHSDDHSDFKTLFDKIEESSLNSEMKLFGEVQRDVLATPNPKGYRWHPK